MNSLNSRIQRTPHWPEYIFCSDPETCCGHWWPVAITCAVDHQRWPCDTKRSHHTESQIARVQRWAAGRLGRPARSGTRVAL